MSQGEKSRDGSYEVLMGSRSSVFQSNTAVGKLGILEDLCVPYRVELNFQENRATFNQNLLRI